MQTLFQVMRQMIFLKKLHSLASNRDSRSPFICALLAFWQCYVAFYRHAGFVDNVCFLLRKKDSILMTFIQSVFFFVYNISYGFFSSRPNKIFHCIPRLQLRLYLLNNHRLFFHH